MSQYPQYTVPEGFINLGVGQPAPKVFLPPLVLPFTLYPIPSASFRPSLPLSFTPLLDSLLGKGRGAREKGEGRGKGERGEGKGRSGLRIFFNVSPFLLFPPSFPFLPLPPSYQDVSLASHSRGCST